MSSETKLFFNWKQAQEVIGIGRELQRQYRAAGILQWTPVGGNGVKPLVFYTLEQLQEFIAYLRDHPREATRKLLEWRKTQKASRRKRR